MGATIVLGLCVSLAKESRLLLGPLERSSPQQQQSSAAVTSKQQEGDKILLDVHLPPLHARRLFEDTQHSSTSPLSPSFRARNTAQQYNLQTYVGCQPTERIRILQAPHNSVQWVIQSLAQDGTPKTVGGDEFYVSFTLESDVGRKNVLDPVTQQTVQHPTLVAIPTDLEDGNYTLEFFTPPVPEWNNHNNLPTQQNGETNGILTIYLTYTCGMGLVTQKSDWKSRGSLDFVHQQPNVPLPPWKAFQPPTIHKKLSTYDYVAAFGDSVLGLFVGQYRDNKKFIRYPAMREFPSLPNLHFRGNIRKPFANNTQELQQLFQKWHGRQLLEQHTNHTTAILMGSGTWDLGKITWTGGDEFFSLEPVLHAYQSFWEWLLQEYPKAQLYWKALSAMHPHNLMDLSTVLPENLERVQKGTMYVSAARAKALDLALVELILEQFAGKIEVLDVYHATALTAEWLFPADSHHYQWEMNRHMFMEWFY